MHWAPLEYSSGDTLSLGVTAWRTCLLHMPSHLGMCGHSRTASRSFVSGNHQVWGALGLLRSWDSHVVTLLCSFPRINPENWDCRNWELLCLRQKIECWTCHLLEQDRHFQLHDISVIREQQSRLKTIVIRDHQLGDGLSQQLSQLVWNFSFLKVNSVYNFSSIYLSKGK